MNVIVEGFKLFGLEMMAAEGRETDHWSQHCLMPVSVWEHFSPDTDSRRSKP